MSAKFFPGCKIKAAYPEASAWLEKVVVEHGWADEVEGCCRVNHQNLTAEDTALCICNNCMAMIDEDAACESLENIWIKIDQDPEFPLPDYSGRVYGLQDCGRAHDRTDVQDAIRSILGKMGIEVVELPDAREKSIFCGMSFLGCAPAQDAGFAPKRYVEGAQERGFFKGYPEEEKQGIIDQHCAAIEVEDVVTYCTACDAGLKAGGKKSISMLELVAGVVK